jgi:hypothetical protein
MNRANKLQMRNSTAEFLVFARQAGEQDRTATIRKFRIVRVEGAREVAREVEHHSLGAIIAVGFRVNSARAIQFRQWATGVLQDFAIRGYVLDRERLKNGAFFSKEQGPAASRLHSSLYVRLWHSRIPHLGVWPATQAMLRSVPHGRGNTQGEGGTQAVWRNAG